MKTYPLVGDRVAYAGQYWTVKAITPRGDVEIVQIWSERTVPVESLTAVDDA